MLDPIIQRFQGRLVLSDADKASLDRISARAQMFGSRIDLIQEGDTLDQVYFIQSGFACRYKLLPNGTRSIIAFLVTGDICNLGRPIAGAIDYSVGTLSECEVVILSCEAADQLTANHPTLNRAFRWAELVDEAILREWVVSMGRRSANERIAHLFCELLVRLQAVGLATETSFDLPFPQLELADAMGLSLVHVNRTLQELRRRKLIVFKNGRLNILDLEALSALAGFNPSYLQVQPKTE